MDWMKAEWEKSRCEECGTESIMMGLDTLVGVLLTILCIRGYMQVIV